MPKTKKKRPAKNPTDPNLLARSVIEAVIGEPLTPKNANNAPKAGSARRGKKTNN